MMRDIAVHLNAQIMGGEGMFDALQRYLKNNSCPDEHAALSASLFAAMARADEMAQRLHALFPDVKPRELNSNPQLVRGEDSA